MTDTAQLKFAARGRWPEILSSLGNIPAEHLDGKHHPCPKCGGTDRFRLINQEAGAVYCNKCFSTKNGDGIAALQWATGRDFPAVVTMLQDHLGLNGNGHSSGNRSSKPPGSPKASGEKSPTVFPTSAEALAVYSRTLGDPTTWYEYTNTSGRCELIVYRWDTPGGKEIRPVSRTADGWACCALPEPRPLYRLPSLATAETVYVSEGEKAADVLIDLGLAATTSPSGSKAAGKADWSPLAGKQVFILPDHDEPGEAYAGAVAGLLAKLDPAPVVKVLRLPNLPDKGDAFDYVARLRSEGASGDEILADIEALAAGAETINLDVGDNPEPSPEASAPSQHKFRIEVVTSAQLDQGVYEVEWFVPYLFAKNLPTIVAAPQKSLKTTLCAALLLAIATGRKFLGHFAEASRNRVLFMSGESGFHTLQESARRICAADGFALADVDGMLWSEQLPQFGNVAHIEETRRVIRYHGIELLAIDPCYLAMPGTDAGNLFVQGELLRDMAFMLRDEGCSLLLIHHTKNIPSQRAHDPLELSDIAWAGFQEFARQWALINRRKPFDPDSDGEHHLWLNVGSSAGHGGLWGLDITEGRRTATTTRRWDVQVCKGSEVREADIQEQEQAKSDRKKRERDAAADTVYQDILQAFVHFPGGATKTKIRERVGQARVFDAAWMKVCNSGELVECRVKGDNGQEYDGWKRKFGDRV